MMLLYAVLAQFVVVLIFIVLFIRKRTKLIDNNKGDSKIDWKTVLKAMNYQYTPLFIAIILMIPAGILFRQSAMGYSPSSYTVETIRDYGIWGRSATEGSISSESQFGSNLFFSTFLMPPFLIVAEIFFIYQIVYKMMIAPIINLRKRQ